MPADGVFGVLAAGRMESALTAEGTRKRDSIQANERDQGDPYRGSPPPDSLANDHHRFSFLLVRRFVISLTRSWVVAVRIAALATRTASEPGAKAATCGHAARSTRRARFRSTAPPRRFPATTASRSGPGARNTTTRFPWDERPSSRIRLISSERTSLAVSAGQTARRARPLRRRAPRIDRPARVRMRWRNPCTFARRRLFG